MPRVLGGSCEACNCKGICCCVPLEITVTLANHYGTAWTGGGCGPVDIGGSATDGAFDPDFLDCPCNGFAEYLWSSLYPCTGVDYLRKEALYFKVYCEAVRSRDGGGSGALGAFTTYSVWPRFWETINTGNTCEWANAPNSGAIDCFPQFWPDGTPGWNMEQYPGLTYNDLCNVMGFPLFCTPAPELPSQGWELNNGCELGNIESRILPKDPKIIPGRFLGLKANEYPPFVSRTTVRYEPDRNGTYLLTRNQYALTPSVKAEIQRTKVLGPDDAARDAVLMFEVYPQRGWSWEDPPIQNAYVVDYRCFRDPEFLVCTLPLGTARPHLVGVAQSGNSTAALDKISFRLDVKEWMGDFPNPLPYTWKIAGASIPSGSPIGSGYEAGETIDVEFAESQTLTGQTKISAASLTVAEVDEAGGILRLTVNNPGEYARFLCHPQSVLSPGTHYSVGDQITFRCEVNGSCDSLEIVGIGTVVDVDDEGGVQDWVINGSDAWVSYGDFPDYTQNCDASPSLPDDRGRFRQIGADLCELYWSGFNIIRGATCVGGGAAVGPSGRTFCETGFWPLAVYLEEVDAFTQIVIGCGDVYNPILIQEFPQFSNEWCQIVFPPFPKCDGVGAQAEAEIEQGANQSVIGGKIKKVNVTNGGTGFAYLEVEHEPPVLPTFLPTPAGGEAAQLSFNFRSVLNYPRPGLQYVFPSGYTLPPKRYAYYPVVSADVVYGGKGYAVNDEFQIVPDNGTGGPPLANDDNPILSPNGTYFGGIQAFTGEEDYIPTSRTLVVGELVRQSEATIRVTAVDADGGITAVEVPPHKGGMMYRPVPAETNPYRRNPLGFTAVFSRPGYGANLQSVVDVDPDSPTFGAVTAVNVVPAPPLPDGEDPLFPGQPMPTGGRDYVGPDTNKISVLRTNEMMQLMAGQDFGFDRFNPEKSSVIFVAGTKPPYIPWSTIMVTDDKCPNHLLDNKTYLLYEIHVSGQRWRPGPIQSPLSTMACKDAKGYPLPDQYIPPDCYWNTGMMQNQWAVLQSGQNEFTNLEWGMTATFNWVRGTDKNPNEGHDCAKNLFDDGNIR